MEAENRVSIGVIGENIACNFLQEKGYRILTRNYRKPWGEIDIVAKAPDRTLVFVEVKTMKAHEWLMPEDNATKAKLKKLKKICESFCARNPQLVDEKAGWRIDLVGISVPVDADILTKDNKNIIISHYENV